MNNTDKSELRQKLEGLEYNGNPVFEDVPAIDMVIALIQEQCNQAELKGQILQVGGFKSDLDKMKKGYFTLDDLIDATEQELAQLQAKETEES